MRRRQLVTLPTVQAGSCTIALEADLSATSS
jgi:hypothetical protein